MLHTANNSKWAAAMAGLPKLAIRTNKARPLGAWGSWIGWMVVALTASVGLLATGTIPALGEAESDPLADWAVDPGTSLEIDTTGYDLPTAIAFVPDPGPDPNDPLYFVTQLRGEIKVVTNDRTTHSFASVPTLEVPEDDLRGTSQQGLAGICLDPDTGHVFVTSTYPDEGGVLRNNITRFATEPDTFAPEPSDVTDFTDVFADFQSAPAHQIGQCAAEDDRIFAGIGDGGDVSAAGDPEQLLGKVVCLTFAGEPCPENSVSDDGDESPSQYVWARGFRNPFGLTMVDGQLYAAENGIDIDRFLRIRHGEDHHWDGSDQSIATGADLVIDPGISPVQLDFVETGHPALGGYGNNFVFAAFHQDPVTGVVAFEYDTQEERVLSVPRHIVEHRTTDRQAVIGAAVGPDGLYFATALPDSTGTSHVMRVALDPNQEEHEFIIGDSVPEVADDTLAILDEHSCISCHSIDGTGGGIAPSLDSFALHWRLTERLNSTDYEEQVAAVDALDEEPFVSFREERAEVLAAEGRDRTRIWLKHFLTEPRFDNPDVQMPNPGLSPETVVEVRDFLYGQPTGGLGRRVAGFVMGNMRAVGIGFVGGFLAAAGFIFLLLLMRWQIRRRRRTSDNPSLAHATD